MLINTVWAANRGSRPVISCVYMNRHIFDLKKNRVGGFLLFLKEDA